MIILALGITIIAMVFCLIKAIYPARDSDGFAWLGLWIICVIVAAILCANISEDSYDKLEANCKSRGDNVLIESGRYGYICIKKDSLG